VVIVNNEAAKTCSQLALLSVLVLSLNGYCFAQRSLNRGINLGALEHSPDARMDSVFQMFQLKIPYLTNKPPIATSMPYPVMLA